MSAVDIWNAVKAAILAEHPDLADDDEALFDTVDGLTDAADIVAAIVRQSREDVAAVEALKALIGQYQARAERIAKRAETRKTAALRMMQAMGVRKIERPEFTLSVAQTPPRVIVTDRMLLPDDYWRVKREPDLSLIRDVLKAGGVSVPGATLSNGGETLKVSVR